MHDKIFGAVGGLKQYSIPFRGLKEGKHSFHFDIENTFFDRFESSEVHEGEILVRIDLEKHSQFLELGFHLSGEIRVNCDRCLEPFPLEIKHQANLYVRFGEETHEQTDEVLILADSANEIILDQYLFEFIHLAIPYKKTHPETKGSTGCDPDMIRKLEGHSFNDPEDDKTDPRWDKLKEMI